MAVLRGTIIATGIAAVLMAVSGCGGSDKAEASTSVSRAAASSLQQAMTATARAIDGVRGTKGSLASLGSSLQSSLDQTGDVISLLTPRATDSPADQGLLKAARDQRSFLQFASAAAAARSRGTGLSAVASARTAGGRASSDYASLAVASGDLAGLLPAPTTFATGRLHDAVLRTTKSNAALKTKAKSSSSAGGGGSSAPAPAAADCGGGISVNAATSCPFGRNVADSYNESGGSSSIDVYSPVTKQDYTMNCTGSSPVVCSGGNNAVVRIR